MQGTPWLSSAFVRWHIIALPGGAFGTVAWRRPILGYATAGIYFKRSNGVPPVGSDVWPDDDDAVLVDNLSGNTLEADDPNVPGRMIWKDLNLFLFVTHPTDAKPVLFCVAQWDDDVGTGIFHSIANGTRWDIPGLW